MDYVTLIISLDLFVFLHLNPFPPLYSHFTIITSQLVATKYSYLGVIITGENIVI